MLDDIFSDNKCPLCETKVYRITGFLAECPNGCCKYDFRVQRHKDIDGNLFERKQIAFLIFDQLITVRDFAVYENGIIIPSDEPNSFQKDVIKAVQYWKENDRYLIEILSRNN